MNVSRRGIRRLCIGSLVKPRNNLTYLHYDKFSPGAIAHPARMRGQVAVFDVKSVGIVIFLVSDIALVWWSTPPRSHLAAPLWHLTSEIVGIARPPS